jgi:hypothetical protein
MRVRTLKKFTGTVKPFFSLDGLDITIKYGEIIALEEWQVNHPSFKFAEINGWVVASDRKTLVFNPVNARPKIQVKQEKAVKNISTTDLPEKGLDPSVIHEILEKQDVFVKQAQKTFERLSKKQQPEAPAINPELINTLIENQQKMMEMLLAKEAAKPTPPTDQTTILQALKLLTNEVKRLQESKPAEPSLDTNQLLEGVKQVISQYTPSQGYNEFKKKDPSGFQIQDNFEEKFIPKVEDLNVKNSKIVTQEKDSGSVEDALAALRKLKEKK